MASKAHVEIYERKREDPTVGDAVYSWRLRASNGEIIATGEGHTRAEDAERAWETVRDTIVGEGTASLIPVKKLS